MLELPLEFQVGIVLELFLVTLLSMIIGFDRERHERTAGLRTHMLVGVGAFLFTIFSQFGFASGDPSRVASNVVTGIGFLGAGTIIRHRGNIYGLTTAASIWVTAAVGMAVGIGAWFIAIISTILIWFILAVLRRVEPLREEHREETNIPSLEDI